MQTETGRDDARVSELRCLVEEFLCLTREALDTGAGEDFFSVLMKREALGALPDHFSRSLSPENVAHMVAIERKLLERLENERRKIIADIDKLSWKMKTVKAYSARFPLPSMPALFDQAG